MSEIKKRNGVTFKGGSMPMCALRLQRNKEVLLATIISARSKMFYDKH